MTRLEHTEDGSVSGDNGSNQDPILAQDEGTRVGTREHACSSILPVSEADTHRTREHSNGIFEARAVVDGLGVVVHQCQSDGDDDEWN